MRRNIIKILCVTSALLTILDGSNAIASTDIDSLYKNAYNLTKISLNEKTQKSINDARESMKLLPKEMDWAIGEFSKQLDRVQAPILVNIVEAINDAENNTSQSKIDKAREVIPNELVDTWKNSYSRAVDKVQQEYLNRALELVKKAETERKQENIDEAMNILEDISTSKREFIAKSAKDLINRVDEIEILKDLTVAILGDSISDPDSNATIKYHSYLKEDYNIKVLAKSGSGFFNPAFDNSQIYNQANNITIEDDIILVFGSFNDISKLYSEEATLGTIGDTSLTTIYGSIERTFDNILLINPDAIIGLVLPTPWEGVNEYLPSTATYYPFMEGYIKALKEVADKREIPILDLFHNSELKPWENNFEYTLYWNRDGIHPNNIAHNKYIYPKVKEFLISLESKISPYNEL